MDGVWPIINTTYRFLHSVANQDHYRYPYYVTRYSMDRKPREWRNCWMDLQTLLPKQILSLACFLVTVSLKLLIPGWVLYPISESCKSIWQVLGEDLSICNNVITPRGTHESQDCSVFEIRKSTFQTRLSFIHSESVQMPSLPSRTSAQIPCSLNTPHHYDFQNSQSLSEFVHDITEVSVRS